MDLSTTSPPTAAPDYHRQLRDHLKATEPELWAWFAETLDPSASEIDEAELELLKSTYRLDNDGFGVLGANATLLASELGIEARIVLYQELHDGGRNARVQMLGNDVHVVFSGDLLGSLDPLEQRAVLAHELAHVALFRLEGGDYRVLDALLHRLADEALGHVAVDETLRRLRLHTEVYADRIAIGLTGDRDAMISAIVKVQSGLRHVDPAAYLRQAEEILLADSSASAAFTHPELHIRVACMAANAHAGSSGASAELLARLIDGPDDLEPVDLLGQLRLQKLTQRVLSSGVRLRSDSAATTAHLQNFTALNVPTLDAAAPGESILDDGELENAQPSVRQLAAALLADFALLDSLDETDGADSVDELGELRALAVEADRIGVAKEFDRILSKATERSLAEVRRLRSPKGRSTRGNATGEQP